MVVIETLKPISSSQNREPTPSIISSVLPILSQFSPALGLLLRTSIHYISLLSICLNDLAVLVFLVGFFIILGDKISGPTLKAGIVEVISDTVEAGWNSARAEL